MEEMRIHTKFHYENPKGRALLGYLSVDGKMMMMMMMMMISYPCA
jgi:hypothetical protein